jgi:apolipoprotein N-acyltransferase
MDVEVLAAIGLAILISLGYVVLHVVGEAAAEAAEDSVFRRPSFAMRRQRHRGLMKAGGICGVLAFGSGFMWLVVVTNDFEDDAADARMFLVLTSVLGLVAAVLLVAWWRRSGHPPR